MRRKYYFILTIGSRKAPIVIQILSNLSRTQLLHTLLVPDAKYKSVAILACRDAIVTEYNLSHNMHDEAATIRLNAALDLAEEIYFANGTYYEQVANDEDLADLAAMLGYKLKGSTSYDKQDIVVKNTLISGVLLIILKAIFGAFYYVIEVRLAEDYSLVFTKTIPKSRGNVSGFTPGVEYLVRAAPINGDNVQGEFTNYFTIRAN